MILWIFAILATVAAARAKADVILNDATYGGTGCVAGTAAVTLSSNQQLVTALFDNYEARLVEEGGKSLDRKSCALAIPMSVRPGYQYSVKKIVTKADMNLNNGASAVYNISVFRPSARDVNIAAPFNGTLNNEQTLSYNLKNGDWSGCGKSDLLRVNTSIVLKSPQQKAALAAIRDRLDLHLKWRRCR